MAHRFLDSEELFKSRRGFFNKIKKYTERLNLSRPPGEKAPQKFSREDEVECWERF